MGSTLLSLILYRDSGRQLWRIKILARVLVLREWPRDPSRLSDYSGG